MRKGEGGRVTRREANFIQIRRPHNLRHPSALIWLSVEAAAWLRFRQDTLQIKSLLKWTSAMLDYARRKRLLFQLFARNQLLPCLNENKRNYRDLYASFSRIFTTSFHIFGPLCFKLKLLTNLISCTSLLDYFQNYFLH